MNPEYGNFDGTPNPYGPPEGHGDFYSDAYRTGANIGLDVLWNNNGKETGFSQIADNLINFFADIDPKDYKKYKLGPWELEVALVDAGTEWEFYYAEIEFPTEQDAKDFVVPAYFGEEITYNKDYKMKNFWKRTRG